MAINVAAKKRGWGYDVANTRLSAYVDGRASFYIRPTGGIGFSEHAGRTGEGTYLYGDGISVGMATPADCEGIKLYFDYGVTPSALTGSGKMVHGLDIKMIMDQEWTFTTNDRNATVRGARIQGMSEDNVGGRVMGIYSNARVSGTSKEIQGIVGGTDAGPGIISLEARTELASSATITTPAVVGLLCWHNSPAGSTLAGDYRAIQIDQPRLPGLTGTTYGIYFGDSNVTGDTYHFDYGIYINHAKRGIYAYASQASPAANDGMAAYLDATITGTSTGDVYAVGSWLNLGASAVLGSNEYRGLDVGVYDLGAAASTSAIIYGLCVSTYVATVTNPSLHAMMRFNTDAAKDVPDCWFFAANTASVAFASSSAETATKLGDIHIKIVGMTGTDGYIRVYDGTS